MRNRCLLVEILLVSFVCAPAFAQIRDSNQYQGERVVLTNEIETVEDAIKEYLLEFATLPRERTDLLFSGKQPISYNTTWPHALWFDSGSTTCEIVVSASAKTDAVQSWVKELCARIPTAGFYQFRTELSEAAGIAWTSMQSAKREMDQQGEHRLSLGPYRFDVSCHFYPSDGTPAILFVRRSIKDFDQHAAEVIKASTEVPVITKLANPNELQDSKMKVAAVIEQLVKTNKTREKLEATWSLFISIDTNTNTEILRPGSRWPVVIRKRFQADPYEWSEIRAERAAKAKNRTLSDFSTIGIASAKWAGFEHCRDELISIDQQTDSFDSEFLEFEKDLQIVDGIEVRRIRFRMKR